MNFYNKHITFSLVVFAGLFSCTNHRSASEKILKNFDSVSKSLEKTNDRVAKSTNTLYAELEKKFAANGGFGKIQQMRYVVQDFYGFVLDLEMKFIAVCGDSSGKMLPEASLENISLTNDFFLKRENAVKLFQQIKKVQTIMLLNEADSLVTKEIADWIMIPYPKENGNEENKFAKGYFCNAPPVAAITILHKFENDVRVFESRILTNYLKQ